jgi:hypothetical protein
MGGVQLLKDLMVLTAENYHSPESNRTFMSVSQFKQFKACQACAKAQIDGTYKRKETKPLLLGQYNHKWVEGGLQHQYLSENYDRFLSVGLITKAGKPNADLVRMDEVVIPSAESDPRIMLALKGEHEVIFTANLYGVPFKIMIDVYNREEGYFSDPKFMADTKKKFNEEKWQYESFVKHFGYDLQMIVYSEVEKIATESLERLCPHLVIITKEPIPKKLIIKGFDVKVGGRETVVEEYMSEFEEELKLIVKVKNGEVEPEACGECDYCKSTMETPIINFWELDGS